MKRTKMIIGVLILALVMSIIAGCGMFTQQYKSKESGKVISENLTKALQAGIAVKMTYDIFKMWKPDLCNTGILNEDQCFIYDTLLYKMNGSLTLYSKATSYWYDLEIKPDADITMDKDMALSLIRNLLLDKDELISGVGNIVGRNIQIPAAIPDFTPFVAFLEAQSK